MAVKQPLCNYAGSTKELQAGDTLPGGGGAITVQDEGITQSTVVTTLNFTGAGVTASGAGAVETINIPGGAGRTIGTATIDFGAAPGSNEASIAVTGQATIGITNKPTVFVMADDTTADHTANDHKYFTALCGLACGTPTAGTGFTIYGRSLERLQGTFALRWAWE